MDVLDEHGLAKHREVDCCRIVCLSRTNTAPRSNSGNSVSACDASVQSPSLVRSTLVRLICLTTDGGSDFAPEEGLQVDRAQHARRTRQRSTENDANMKARQQVLSVRRRACI